LAEKAIRAEKVVDQPAAIDVELPNQLRETMLWGQSMTSRDNDGKKRVNDAVAAVLGLRRVYVRQVITERWSSVI
jgi:hypothetical protein